ncbi:MAG: DNA-formamidopyrimidine glycosylase family protein [Actinomycetes bacterium]
MPEGDTVWLVARRMHDALAGHVLTAADLRVPRLATVDLTGREVTEVVSRGKHLLTRLGGRATLHTHLRMDGAWHLYRHGTRWRGGPAWQVRVVLTTDAWQSVGFRLPVVELLPTTEEHRVVGHLGPDLLGDDWDADEAVRRLRADSDRPVGEALLDQRNLAGLGNLYRVELCFLAGVTPWAPVRDVPDLRRVVGDAHRLLRANRHVPEQVTTGDPGRGRRHHVFERTGRPCHRCGALVRRGMQQSPPRERVTYWCPGCQRGPSPPGTDAPSR